MPDKQSHLSFYWYLPPIFLSDAALAYAIDLANGDIEDEREIIDVEYEEISSTYDDAQILTPQSQQQ